MQARFIIDDQRAHNSPTVMSSQLCIVVRSCAQLCIVVHSCVFVMIYFDGYRQQADLACGSTRLSSSDHHSPYVSVFLAPLH